VGYTQFIATADVMDMNFSS